MFKNELIAKVARVLSENNIRKPVHIDKRVLRIMDVTYKDEALSGQVHIKPKDKLVKYTAEDVSNILEGIIACVQDSLQHGESVAIKGLGNFNIVWRNPRRVRRLDNGEMIDIPGRYAPKFSFSQNLLEAAKIYTLSKENNPVGFEIPDPVYDQFEFPDDEDGDEVNDNAEG